MTDTSKRTRNASSPLGAGEAFDRLTVLRDTRYIRRQVEIDAAVEVFDKAEAANEEKLLARVPEDQKARLNMMLAAVREQDAKVPEALREPLTAERLAVGKR